jgi:hypothetical protein
MLYAIASFMIAVDLMITGIYVAGRAGGLVDGDFVITGCYGC